MTLPRDKWSRPSQFILGCLALNTSVSSFWRFPFLMFKNGGVAFLIPCVICLLFGAYPLFLLEVGIGQYTSQGTITSWNYICPLFTGVGFAMVLVLYLAANNYQMVNAWLLYYLVSSFRSVLPWSSCDNRWNTENCGQPERNYALSEYNYTFESQLITPATEFWERAVLEINRSDGVDDVGVIKWSMAAALGAAWVITYLCLFRGIRWTGKILYVTVTVPYILMLALLVRGLTLPGSRSGIDYFIIPNYARVLEPGVWIDAAVHMYYAFAGMGTLVALGSFNKPNHNFVRDGFIVAVVILGTSLLCGFIVFSFCGYLSLKRQVALYEVVEGGFSLVFVVFPEAIASLPMAPVWSIIFFLMLILLAMNTQLMAVEGCVTAVLDLFPKLLRRKCGREVFLAIFVVIAFVMGLLMCTYGGIYVFTLMDTYFISIITYFVTAGLQAIGGMWIFGLNRFAENIMSSGGRGRRCLWKTKAIFLPFFLMVAMFFATFVSHELLSELWFGDYQFPFWSVLIGIGMIVVPLLLIPITALVMICCGRGSCYGRLKQFITPQEVPPEGQQGDSVELSRMYPTLESGYKPAHVR